MHLLLIPQSQSNPIPDTHFQIDLAYVLFDNLMADSEFVGDFAVREALGDLFYDEQLSLSRSLQWRLCHHSPQACEQVLATL